MREWKIPNAIVEMLDAVDTDGAVFPPTILYNEGWMLRLVLSAAAQGTPCLPFSFLPGSRWFSEALLYSPFLPRFKGDALSETWTHIDGVVGHFRFTPTTKTGLELSSDATQFIAVEAKMFSPLSKGVKNAPFYDQAARTVACMATTVERAGRSIGDFDSIGYYVVAPAEQIDQNIFSQEMSHSSVAEKVRRRAESYKEDGEYSSRLRIWFRDAFEPLISRIELSCWPWESAVDAIVTASPAQKDAIEGFYKRCLKHNQKLAPSFAGGL